MKAIERETSSNQSIEVVILAGGKGTRLHPLTRNVPKPMLTIGPIPILEHVIEIFEYFGFKRFKILTGYKGKVIRNYLERRNSTSHIECIPTGIESDTAERIWRIRNKVSDTFFLSYADVLADIDFKTQLRFHHEKGKIGTMAVAPLTTTYGVVKFNKENIAFNYLEKPILYDYWINAGFFVFNSSIFDHWEKSEKDFSKGMLPLLAKSGKLACYKHDGFWGTMDTIREYEVLNELWNRGEAKWAVWKEKKS
jgi:glucose-1-phosphate cytidylyltransferase